MLEMNLVKNNNEQMPECNGKYYANIETKGIVGVDELAKHMHKHSAIWTRGLVKGLLSDVVDCIRELALEGKSVKIDDLGLFKASVEANGLTLVQGAVIAAKVGAQRTAAELTANPSVQQAAVKSVKLIMQTSGDARKSEITEEAELKVTSKTKALILSLTGNEAQAPANSEPSTPSGGGNTGGNTGGDNNGGGGGNDPEDGDMI